MNPQIPKIKMGTHLMVSHAGYHNEVLNIPYSFPKGEAVSDS